MQVFWGGWKKGHRWSEKTKSGTKNCPQKLEPVPFLTSFFEKHKHAHKNEMQIPKKEPALLFVLRPTYVDIFSEIRKKWFVAERLRA